MAELRPYPFAALVRRALRELDAQGTLFDIPRRKLYTPSGRHELATDHHGFPASTPLGPAAGPHTQMAQNIAMAWLGGCRIIELKTVQIMDELKIPRPCIDMQTIGFNVEWSQELRLEESLEEYVKAAMLITILRASGQLPAAADDQVIFDMSVGYDLAGIRSERVQAFIDGLRECSALVDRLRAEIPDEHRRYRDLEFPTRLSDTLTLSTFHGCPPDEIEKIIEFLLEEKGIHSTVKLNPTLLGPARARELLGETLGYGELEIPDSAFEKDTQWQQAVDFCGRLADRADGLGLSFGVKFSNTLIVKNHRDFFPRSEEVMYLSGPPLHVLAVNLVGRFRGVFGDRLPISFSAGIDRQNFADAAAIGRRPITVCSDLLKPGGYGRASAYLGDLEARMDAAGASDLRGFIVRAYGRGEAALDALGLAADDPVLQASKDALATGGDLAAAAGAHYDAWVSAAILENTRVYVARATADPRYARVKNAKAPRKVGTHLALFDCLSCNKCVPVCPNDANFVLEIPAAEVPLVHLIRTEGGWERREVGVLKAAKGSQYANFADFCNECGNCDVFCPEEGGPYLIKPRFFGALADFEALADHDGFHLSEGGRRIHARFGGRALRVDLEGERVRVEADGVRVSFAEADPAGTIAGEAAPGAVVDLGHVQIVRWIRDAVFAEGQVSYVRLLAEAAHGRHAPPPAPSSAH
ncbi:MAG: glutamate synthase [Myxococcales bacterium]|nr:glutamate synthase [Myxococcales bacterium]